MTRGGERHDVGYTSDFEEGHPRTLRVGSREIVVVRWRGEFYALRNVCPHQAQQFEHGVVCDDLTATFDGELSYGPPVLTCPWHNWPFDLRTGQCTVDESKRVRAFPVQIEDDRVLISLSGTRE